MCNVHCVMSCTVWLSSFKTDQRIKALYIKGPRKSRNVDEKIETTCDHHGRMLTNVFSQEASLQRASLSHPQGPLAKVKGRSRSAKVEGAHGSAWEHMGAHGSAWGAAHGSAREMKLSGGASVGLTRAGCVGAVDVSEDALAIYAANFSGHATHRLDLSTPLPVELVAEWRTELREGVVWASSPCTGFSLATRRPRLGTRSLTLAVANADADFLVNNTLI